MVRRRAGGAGPPGTVDVAAADQVPTTPPFKAVRVGGQRIVLVRHPAGHLVAFPDACPHLGQPLRKAELDGAELTCRHHRHRYDLGDGRCTWPGGPYDEHLPLWEVGEVDGRVWVRAPAGDTGAEVSS